MYGIPKYAATREGRHAQASDSAGPDRPDGTIAVLLEQTLASAPVVKLASTRDCWSAPCAETTSSPSTRLPSCWCKRSQTQPRMIPNAQPLSQTLGSFFRPGMSELDTSTDVVRAVDVLEQTLADTPAQDPNWAEDVGPVVQERSLREPGAACPGAGPARVETRRDRVDGQADVHCRDPVPKTRGGSLAVGLGWPLRRSPARCGGYRPSTIRLSVHCGSPARHSRCRC